MNKKRIAIVDCAINDPVSPCFNRFMERTGHLVSYYLPAKFGNYDLENRHDLRAILILGSASSVNDELPWQDELTKLAIAYLQKGVAVFGFCFGHQLIAKGFGAKVDYVYSDQRRIFGKRVCKITKSVSPLNKGEQFDLVVNHRQEIKSLPDCLVQLGTSEECNLDAIAHLELPFFGFQGHPEASQHFITNYLGNLDDQESKIAVKDGDRLVDLLIDAT